VILPDVNILVYAFRADLPEHKAHRTWLRATLDSESRFAVSELVMSGFLRVVTNARIFVRPDPLGDALAFVDAIRSRPNCTVVRPGARHWPIFVRLCREANAKGPLVADAYHAALAIEAGCEWITTDRDYARFPDLRWRHPV
jgi:toxin-antitoxin system PIN domain toxin